MLLAEQLPLLLRLQPRCPPPPAQAGVAITVTTKACNSSSSRERQHVLWHHFFTDPSQWWDNRAEKKGPSHPDFRHKGSKEPLWLDNTSKPGWVDLQLAMWDARMRLSAEDVERLSQLCEQGLLQEAVGALELLVQQGSCSCAHTTNSLFYPVLKKCRRGTGAESDEQDLGLAMRVHALAVATGFHSDAFLANHIISMYASHGAVDEAMSVFTEVTEPNVYMWASIIWAHARHGRPQRAIQLYRAMRQAALVKPDSHIFVGVLTACASAQDLLAGKEVHVHIQQQQQQQQNQQEQDDFVSTSLVHMYAKCGSLEDARKVFDHLSTKNVVTWNAMIAGYARAGMGRLALDLYAGMQMQGMTRAAAAAAVGDQVTLACLLRACASVGAVQQGKQLHSQIRETGLEGDAVVGTCLIDMYCKCGSLEDARRVFDALPSRDVVAWNAMLNGYAEHGLAGMAMECFGQLQMQVEQGGCIRPDAATFVSLLAACSHAGLVQQGQGYFRMMVEEQGIQPTDLHYNCMVHLLGRSGLLEEAESMLLTTSLGNPVVGWTALLTACRSFGDVERGRRCFERLVELDAHDASCYVLLGNIYANAGRWEDVGRIERLRKNAGAKKIAAKACIEVEKEVHEFTVGDDRCSRPDISFKLRSENARLKEEGGHVPHTELVLKAVSEQEKEDALCGHAEKLALAYGLLNTPEGTPLLVTKNLRMCSDCHSSTQIMSRLERREIIVRDAHRVHRFLDGSCSCDDRRILIP